MLHSHLLNWMAPLRVSLASMLLGGYPYGLYMCVYLWAQWTTAKGQWMVPCDPVVLQPALNVLYTCFQL
jgi:hypothetical protein